MHVGVTQKIARIKANEAENREQVAYNVIIRAEKFLFEHGEHKLAGLWIKQMLTPHKEPLK